MKHFLKWAAIVLGSLILFLILVVGLFLGWLRWSGEIEWKQAQAELRAKGEKLTFAELVPPMPPDSENFFADPLWAEYSDLVQKKNEIGTEWLEPRLPREKRQLEKWHVIPLTTEEMERIHQLIPGGSTPKDRSTAFSLLRTRLYQETDPQKQKEAAALFLQVISPAQPMLNRIAKLSERPQAQFPIRYDLCPYEPLPHLTPILHLAQIINRKALSEIMLGKTNEASADTQTLLRLTSIQKDELLLISFLVRRSSISISLEVINQGILRHSWTESDLNVFQDQLDRMNLLKDFLRTLKVDRAFLNQCNPSFVGAELINTSAKSSLWEKTKAKLVQLYLGSILLKDRAFQNLWLQRYADSLNANIPKGWNGMSTGAAEQEINNIAKNPLKKQIYLLNVISAPFLSPDSRKTAEVQTQVDQTVIACALERYRIAHGAYPASLAPLVPEYIAKLPNSPITGKPMNYSLKPDGTFLLWTPDWNLKSLGGKPGEYRGDGDIVWGQPVPRQDPPTTTPKGK